MLSMWRMASFMPLELTPGNVVELAAASSSSSSMSAMRSFSIGLVVRDRRMNRHCYRDEQEQR
jgi:hypothetical protein